MLLQNYQSLLLKSSATKKQSNFQEPSIDYQLNNLDLSQTNNYK